jgi:F-type H+-transporting ATPase subunit b
MPQLDISTYIPQIFWFLICFAVLYTFVACIILPRITNILKERKRVIDADLTSAHELDSKIDDLQIRTEKLRREANLR